MTPTIPTTTPAVLQLAIQPTDTIDVLLNGHASKTTLTWVHGSTNLPTLRRRYHVTGPARRPDVYGTCPGCDAFGYVDDDGDPGLAPMIAMAS